jgi:pimeloyl-ACP methyl ester carboxylesterase
MWKLVVFGVLLLLIALFALLLVINGAAATVKAISHADKSRALLRMRHNGILLLASALLCAFFTALTRWTASTPPIRDEQGNAVVGSIAKMMRVELNGRNEWITLRGQDTTKPVLLFLAGGPGGTQMGAARQELKELEKHFVVVNWDQPGSGKSYTAVPRNELTPDTYVEDGIALTQYLLTVFPQEKIYLAGESWGSALAIFMAQERPELYHAVIGTAQMVAFEETERIDYALAMELAEKAGDDGLVKTLQKNGPPPYYGKDVALKSGAYLNYLSGIMARNPEIHNAGYNTFRDLASDEYGVWDEINFVRGVVNTFSHVYPQLYPVDLRRDCAALQVPVYFFLGKHDINAPLSLAQAYYDALDAPHKEIVWFEHSGHSPWINERDKFVRELVRIANGGAAHE